MAPVTVLSIRRSTVLRRTLLVTVIEAVASALVVSDENVGSSHEYEGSADGGAARASSVGVQVESSRIPSAGTPVNVAVPGPLTVQVPLTAVSPGWVQVHPPV